ncbi:MAG TPA: hypothetical protein VFV38_41630 [Ktedonobacteraceae bacterium]|nr:hypothetical protein [Ktedonobacteraceae bacterium]
MMLTNPGEVKARFGGQYDPLQHLLVEREVAARIMFVAIQQGKNANA